MTRHSRAHRRDSGASAVEYGLLVAGIAVTFLAAAIGLQAAVGTVFGSSVTSITKNDAPPSPAATP